MTKRILIAVFSVFFITCANNSILFAEEKGKTVAIEILNPKYTKPANINDNVEINTESTIEDIFKKINYYYATHDWDKAIELCELALKKTDDRNFIANINFSLSSHYLQKGNEAYQNNKDDSFYKLSIQYAKKCLESIPNSWQALANIGSVYLNTGDYKQAIFYFSEAEKYLDKNDPNYVALEIHRNMAEELDKGK